MGWNNYIIVEELKMVIETHREVDELEEYIKESLDKMIVNDVYTDISTSDLKVADITVQDLCVMASAYENASVLENMSVDKLFLYWLNSRDIKYEIKSEYNIKLKQYKENGYKIVRIWRSDNEDDDNNDEDVIDDNKGDEQKSEEEK